MADAIISNPVSYAHVHCAEALGIPLHLMFPQVRRVFGIVIVVGVRCNWTPTGSCGLLANNFVFILMSLNPSLQPWTPTKAFPHPLSCLSYQQGWSAENYISYQVTLYYAFLSALVHNLITSVYLPLFIDSSICLNFTVLHLFLFSFFALPCSWWTACCG